MGPWMWGYYGGGGLWSMLFGGLVPLVLLVGLVALIWSVAARAAGPSASALQELQLRYVRGEITREQYVALRRDLKQLR